MNKNSREAEMDGQSRYYLAYEERYKKVYAAGAELWGHSPDDAVLNSALEGWVGENALSGKRVIEFACGEGACGVILSRLGCVYHGVDIAPSAVEKAKRAIGGFPSATVSRLDMTREKPLGIYDAALDVMGFHMLVADPDRRRYLRNMYDSLCVGASVLFFRECFREDAYEGGVESFEAWKRVSGSDYETPEKRRVMGSDIWVDIPLVPARARTKEGYVEELTAAGFRVEAFVPMDSGAQISYSASIYARREEKK